MALDVPPLPTSIALYANNFTMGLLWNQNLLIAMLIHMEDTPHKLLLAAYRDQ